MSSKDLIDIIIFLGIIALAYVLVYLDRQKRREKRNISNSDNDGYAYMNTRDGQTNHDHSYHDHSSHEFSYPDHSPDSSAIDIGIDSTGDGGHH